MNETFDVVIVGAGIAGVSTALHLQQRGKKVALIDRRGAGQETSYGNSGVIGNTYILPFGFPSWKKVLPILMDRDISARLRYADLLRSLPWIVDFFFKSLPTTRRENCRNLWPLQMNSIADHSRQMQGAGASHYLSSTGRVALYRSEETFAGDIMERDMAKELGVTFDVMDAAEFQSIEPHLRPVYRKAVRWPMSARINNPGALVGAYAEKFVSEGGVFLENDVSALNQVGDYAWHVETRQGKVLAGQVVVCAGPWAMEMLKPLGYKFPLGFKRGYHRHFAATGGAMLSHAILDYDRGYLIIPMEQGYRLTTGVEFAGLHAPSTPVQIDRALPHASELFPLGEAVDAEPWHGSRPCFPDSLPVIDRAPRHKGLWFNIGHGHFGFTIGPSTGRLLAEMMVGEKTFCDPTPYRATRFNC